MNLSNTNFNRWRGKYACHTARALSGAKGALLHAAVILSVAKDLQISAPEILHYGTVDCEKAPPPMRQSPSASGAPTAQRSGSVLSVHPGLVWRDRKCCFTIRSSSE